MGFFGSGDKTTSTSNSQVGASDDALLINTGIGSTNKFGSTEIVGSTLKLGSNEIGSNTGTVNYGLGAVEVTKLLSDATSGIGNLVKQQSDAASKSVADVVTGLQDLALSKQTNGESSRDNTILWLAGLGLAALVAGFALVGGKRNG